MESGDESPHSTVGNVNFQGQLSGLHCAHRMSDWVKDTLDELADESCWSYQAGGVLAAEPASLAALALAAHGRLAAAARACERLKHLQAANGSVGITADQATPCWPTGWAVLAWLAADRGRADAAYRDNMQLAIGSILALHGRTSENSGDMGHDARLDGWPWVDGTHPWCEPTAINLLALKASGHGDHPRAREAVAMLIDRLLPDGGCNYGNTSVLGQVLRPHVEPTGLVLTALAGEADPSGRIERSLNYLKQAVCVTAGGVSLAYGLFGLTAHGRRPADAVGWLAAPARQTQTYRSSPLRKALLALAAAEPCPLITA